MPYDEDVEIGVRVGRLGRSSLCWELGLFQKHSEELSTTGEIIWVYTNIEDHQSVPIPEDRRKQLTEPPAQCKGAKTSFILYLLMNSMNLAKVLQIEMNLHDNY